MSGETGGCQGIIQAVASLSEPSQCDPGLLTDAYAVEIRLDLMPDIPPARVDRLAGSFDGPIILTLRSVEEGGRFTGDEAAFIRATTPFLPYVTMVDVETRFQGDADRIREMGITIISSCHTDRMLTRQELETLCHRLRGYGDIPKIAVRPQDTADLLTLLSFTHAAAKPIIVSVTGVVCRSARPLLPLFGSLFTYCYIGTPTSPGQYSLEEMKCLSALLSPVIMDTWFDPSPPHP